jgi:mannose-6-phosphate isomerase-like protein (cupin superfamily)
MNPVSTAEVSVKPEASVGPSSQVVEREVVLSGETRPWGEFLVLSDAPHYKCKQLRVKPGQRLSLQYHYKREEHWIVTQGHPEITVGERTWQAKPGEYIFIPLQAQHRLTNPTDQWVELVEVQLGQSFEETDIVRLQDDYQR